MSSSPQDWTKLFGAIDVGLGGVSPSPLPSANQPPAKPAPTAPAVVPLQSNPAPGNTHNTQVAPGVFQMAASFSGSMAKFAAGGFRTTTAEVQSERLAICEPCAHRQATHCVLCGCILPLKAKMPHEMCPVNKWPR